MEEWKDILGFEGLYRISNTGRVLSVKRTGRLQDKELKIAHDGNGYCYVVLRKNNKSFMRKIHRLVAQAFIPNNDNLPEVNHKDENKDNNNVDNLEWCTRKYNNSYGTRLQKLSIAHKGKIVSDETKRKISNSKSTPVKCIETGIIYQSANEASIHTGANSNSIRRVCNGKKKTTKGFHWEYVKGGDE